MQRFLGLFCGVLFFAACASTGYAERLTPESLWELSRIGDAAVSPDGNQLAYLVTNYDLAENAGTVSLLVQEIPSARGEVIQKSLAFDTPLLTAEVKTLKSNVKGLHSLSWFNHPSGPKLVYIAPAASEQVDDASDSDASDSDASDSDASDSDAKTTRLKTTRVKTTRANPKLGCSIRRTEQKHS